MDIKWGMRFLTFPLLTFPSVWREVAYTSGKGARPYAQIPM